MKKKISLSLVFALLLSLAVLAMPAFAAEATNPAIVADTSWYDNHKDASVYFISDAADLMGLSALSVEKGVTFAGKTIELTADIDLNPGWNAAVTVDETTGKATLPATPTNLFEGVTVFSGTFDGRGHTISGVYMKYDMSQMSSGQHFGFFYQTTGAAAIQNLVIKNSLSYSLSTTGAMGGGKGISALVGCATSGTLKIDNVYVDADILHVKQSSSNHSMLGGIIGRIDNTDVPVIQDDTTVKYSVNVSNTVFAGRIITVDKDMKTNQTVLNTAQFCAGGQQHKFENVTINNELKVKQYLTRGIFTNCVAMGKIISGNTENYGEGKNTFVNLIESALPQDTTIGETSFKVVDPADYSKGSSPFNPFASYDAELAKAFVYSADAKAFVPSSVADMLNAATPAMPNDSSYDPNATEPTEEVTTGKTENNKKPAATTEKPADSATAAPGTDAPAANEEKGGCKSVAGCVVVGILAIAAVPAFCFKKKD